MRKLIPIFFILIVIGDVMLLVGTAAARGCNDAESGQVATEADCDKSRPGGNQAASGSSGAYVTTNGGRGASAATASSKEYEPYDRLIMGQGGQGCVTTGYREVGTDSSDAAPTDPSKNDVAAAHGNVFSEYPPCPEVPPAPGQPASVAAPATRAMEAARHWEKVPLPKPQPTIQPGRAITGKLAYLETGGTVSHIYRNETVFGPLEIVASGTYTVDWGDGETTGPYNFEGAPWPNGRISHQYRDVGQYDIVVTERWIADWRIGDESGVLRRLQTTGRINDFPVQQIQAVIAR